MQICVQFLRVLLKSKRACLMVAGNDRFIFSRFYWFDKIIVSEHHHAIILITRNKRGFLSYKCADVLSTFKNIGKSWYNPLITFSTKNKRRSDVFHPTVRSVHLRILFTIKKRLHSFRYLFALIRACAYHIQSVN